MIIFLQSRHTRSWQKSMCLIDSTSLENVEMVPKWNQLLILKRPQEQIHSQQKGS